MVDREIDCQVEIFINLGCSFVRASQSSALEGGGTTFFTVI